MNIYQYLIAINEGRAFNAQRLRKLLDEQGLSLDELGTQRLILLASQISLILTTSLLNVTVIHL